MIRRSFRFAKRTVALFFDVALGLFFLALLGFFALLWRFSEGPVDVTFAADYVREALTVRDSGTTVAFDSIVAEWPRFDGPVSLGLSGFKILENGREALSIDSVGFRIAKAPLLIGLVKPEAIVLNRPTVQVIRETGGDFRFLFGSSLSGPRPETPEKKMGLRELGESLFFEGGKGPGLFALFSRLERFEVKNALLVTEDHISKATWVVPDVSAQLRRKPHSFSLFAAYKAPIGWEKSQITLEVRRDKKTKDVRFEAATRHLDLGLFARNFLTLQALDGQTLVIASDISGTLDDQLRPSRLEARVTSEQGALNISRVFGKPVSFSNLAANISYDRGSGKVSVHDTRVFLNDVQLQLSAEHDVGQIREGGTVPVRLHIPRLTFSQVAAMWPDEHRDTPAAEWLTRRLSEGTIRNLDVLLDVDPKDLTVAGPDKVRASFAFENLKTDYRSPLIPATAAKGHAVIEDDALKITVESGKVAELGVKNASVLVTNLTRPTPGIVEVGVKLSGPLKTALTYIARDPILVTDIVPGGNAAVQGQADLDVSITFPAVRDLLPEDVAVKVLAKLTDIRLPKAVRGLDLVGGPFQLDVREGGFTLSGKGLLDERPIDLRYAEYLPASANPPFVRDITARLSADQRLRDHFGVRLDQFVEGSVPIEFHYKEPRKGQVSLDIRADLTPVRFRVRPFAYSKPEGIPGKASCTASLSGDEIEKIRDLNVEIGDAVFATGSVDFGSLGGGRDVRSGHFNVKKLGPDNSFDLRFEQTSPNNFVFDVKGKSLDARSLLNAREEEGIRSATPGPAVRVSALAERVRTGRKDDQFVRNARITASVDPEGEVHKLDILATAGQGDVFVAIKPDPRGVMQLDLRAEDAGATLYAFDIYDHMVGGSLKIRGEQIPGRGVNDIKGKAVISDFSVVKAPALAQLVNAFSISGLAELLQNKGIAFTKLKADFLWTKRPEGRTISLVNGRTSGASVGLSFGGLVNQTKGTVDLSGTIVPMSGINSLVGKIPLVGTLLTGGSTGGLIAATYAVKGDSSDPSVFVNPLSVLAPGFLRSILFGGGIDMNPYDDFDDDISGQTPPPLAPKKSHETNE